MRNKNVFSPTLATITVLTLVTLACSISSVVPTPEPLPTYTPYPTHTPPPTPTAQPSNNTLHANEDEAAFMKELSAVMADAGWNVSEIDENTILIDDSASKYAVSYIYHTAKISRIAINSPWEGRGEENLALETLKKINQLNDDYNFATISVDTDGDIWIATAFPFGQEVDIKIFLNFIEWFQDTESYFITELLADELAN